MSIAAHIVETRPVALRKTVAADILSVCDSGRALGQSKTFLKAREESRSSVRVQLMIDFTGQTFGSAARADQSKAVGLPELTKRFSSRRDPDRLLGSSLLKRRVQVQL